MIFLLDWTIGVNVFGVRYFPVAEEPAVAIWELFNLLFRECLLGFINFCFVDGASTTHPIDNSKFLIYSNWCYEMTNDQLF